MKNTLQYIYSISVFTGVLITAYFMMNNESDSRHPVRLVQTPGYQMEATFDPAVSRLFQIEGALAEIKKKQSEIEAKRFPTQK